MALPNQGIFGAQNMAAIKKKKDTAQSLALLQQQASQKALDDKLDALVAARPGYSSLSDTEEYKKLSGLANEPGDLPQYALLKQQAEAAAAAGNEKLAQQLNDELQNQAISGAGAQENAYSQLAMGGGLSGGARERIAASGAESQLLNAQKARLAKDRGSFDIGANLTSGLLDLGAKSASEKLGLQGTLLGQKGSDLANQNTLTQSQYNQGIEIAAAKAKAQKEQDAAAGAQKGGKIICTKLNAMGLLNDEVYAADERFGRWVLRNHPDAMFGYLAWASYVVKLLNKFPVIAYIIAPAVRAWANEMAYRFDGKTGKPSFIGKAIMSIGWQFSKLTGFFVYTKRRGFYGHG